MARKSRKEPIQANGNSKDIIEQISEKNIDFQKEVRKDRLPTAAYIRLSVENNGHEGEESLRTQISLVESYIHENEELELLETYVDNGYSGTKFAGVR